MIITDEDLLSAVVLTNAEAYDQWPSAPERLDVQLIVSPATTPIFRLVLGTRTAQRWIYRIAVENQGVLTDEVLAGFTRPNMATPERWLRLRRFLQWQLDREHNLETMRAVDGIRSFRRPTLTFNFRSCRLLKLLSDDSCEHHRAVHSSSYRDPGSPAWNRFSAIPSGLLRMRNYQSSCPKSRSVPLILTAGLVSARTY